MCGWYFPRQEQDQLILKREAQLYASGCPGLRLNLHPDDVAPET